jgi:hypothetical protein
MFAVDFQLSNSRSLKRNRRTSSLLGDNVWPGIKAVYAEMYSSKRNPLNPNRQRTSIRTSPQRSMVHDEPMNHDGHGMNAEPTDYEPQAEVSQEKVENNPRTEDNPRTPPPMSLISFNSIVGTNDGLDTIKGVADDHLQTELEKSPKEKVVIWRTVRTISREEVENNPRTPPSIPLIPFDSIMRKKWARPNNDVRNMSCAKSA